jgi:hypothetical protein
MALDGELAREDLSRREAARLDEAEALLAGVVRNIPDELSDLTAAVLERVGNVAVEPRKSLLDWVFAPRQVVLRWRPVYAFGMAAALATVMLVSIRLNPSSSLPGAASSSPQVLVQFRLDAPGARHVALAGDFTEWKPTYTLNRSEPGVWTVVVAVAPGVHDYAFVVDGQRWVADPMAPAIADGFGGMNSRLAVLAPDQGRGI